MSLLEDVNAALDKGFSPDEVVEALPDVVLTEDEYVESGRWSEHWRAVYHRKTIVSREPIEFLDEYVAVEYSVPATEMQEVDSSYDDIYVVTRREVKKFEYVREQ